MSPKELLWADSEVYHRRLEKSGVALIAVQRTLSADRQLVPGIDAFLRLYEWVARAAPDHFTQVWQDPGAYFWTRRAVHFLAACRGEPLGTVEREYCSEVGIVNPREALAYHLAHFKKFALALAIVTGKSITFSAPYGASLPLAIPGTPLVLVGDSHASIAGFSDGAIELLNPRRTIPVPGSDPGNSADNGNGVRIDVCPSVTCDDVSVFLNSAIFHLPGLGIARGWSALPLAFQFEHQQLVTEALSAIRRFQPWTFSHLAAGLRVIGLKPPDEMFVNVSASELPGAFVCTVPADPYLFASSIIHEFHHNTLFGIEEQGPFFEASEKDSIEGENHYSPWVETLRPLHGIMHAVYVFLAVFRFWSAVLREGSSDEGRLAYTREFIARIPVQLRMGINQLRRHARFTTFGLAIFEQMTRE